MLQRPNSNNEEIENIAVIAAYIDYLMNLEENSSTQSSDGRPISRWREFGLQKEFTYLKREEVVNGNTYWKPRCRRDVGQ